LRKSLLVTVAGVLLLLSTACAESTPEAGGGATPSAGQTASCDAASLNLVTAGTLTVGTDVPAFQPWFGGTGKEGKWKGVPNQGTGNPYTGEGYESAVTYAIADQLGFTKDQVTWVPVAFNESYAPGPKDFDFDINEVSVTPERSGAVTFSDGYFDDNQAIVVNKGTPIASATSIADLTGYKLGVQIGTTSFQFVQDQIQPTEQPAVFNNSTDVIQALNNKQIDGYVVDAPTAYVNVLIGQAKNGVVVGQFANTGEHFGLVLALGNPLVDCVNQAIATLKDDGTLESLRSQWLADLDYPVLS
jgi:polar amino acid transport system substrate-binding protein